MSGSIVLGANPKKFTMWYLKTFLQLAPEIFKPYNARTNFMTFPSRLFPHSIPATKKILSPHGALIYVLEISHAKIYKSFKAATKNSILTVSKDTTLK